MSIDKIEYYHSDLAMPEIERCFHGLKKLPISSSRVHVFISCDISVANGLRRELSSEMPGHALNAPIESFIHTEESDPFMMHNFISARIGYIRLVPVISDEIKENFEMSLHVVNTSPTLLSVYSGDFKVTKSSGAKIMFNPTYKIAELQPGKCIHIDKIQIIDGTGSDHAKFNVACNASLKHLDIPEMDIKEILNGDAMSQSGYTIPSQLSNPKKHMVMFNLPATYGTVDEIKHVLVGALEHMRSRLNRIKASIIINQKRGLVDFKVNKTDDIYQCTLRISQETMTIGNLIRHYIYENDKTVANLSVKSGKHAEDISINIGHTIQPEALIKKAISHAVSDLEKLTSDVMKITPKHYPMEKYITDFNASAKI